MTSHRRPRSFAPLHLDAPPVLVESRSKPLLVGDIVGKPSLGQEPHRPAGPPGHHKVRRWRFPTIAESDLRTRNPVDYRAVHQATELRQLKQPAKRVLRVGERGPVGRVETWVADAIAQ